MPEGFKVAVFANGCFWGSEKGIWRLPAGIHSTTVGYCAGFTPNPTYEEVQRQRPAASVVEHLDSVLGSDLLFTLERLHNFQLARCALPCIVCIGVQRAHGPHGRRARGVQPRRSLLRGHPAVVLGSARPVQRHGPRQRPRIAVPVGARNVHPSTEGER